MRRLLLTAGLLSALSLQEAAAETYALVVGIDAYPHEVSLDGAVKDAEDVAAALTRAGITDISKFIDGEADKDALRAAWTAFVAKAARDDTIIFTYAGHGSQMPELVAGDEADKLDEFLQLPGFDRSRPLETDHEIIVDNELNAWFAEAEEKGIHVLFVSDSCHSGGMSRSFSGKTRLAPAVTVQLSAPSPEAVSGAKVRETDFEEVTVLAASLESQPTPEVIIGGEPRGALSWSFARALEGAADRNGDGLISRLELEDYVFSNVKNQSEALQVPNFVPQLPRSESEIVVSLTRSATPPAEVEAAPADDEAAAAEVETAPADVEIAPAEVEPTPTEVEIAPAEVETAATEIETAPAEVETPVADTKPANGLKSARDLGWDGKLSLSVTGSTMTIENIGGGGVPYRWDAASENFYTPNGDLAGQNIAATRVQGVVDKFVLLDFLKALASQNPGTVSLQPVKDLYASGDRIAFDAPASGYANTIIFNLANTGEVQLLDVQSSGDSQEFKLTDLEVVEPFGADHLVAIATNEPVDAIGAALARPDIGASTLLTLLETRIDATDTSVAIQPLYTRETP